MACASRPNLNKLSTVGATSGLPVIGSTSADNPLLAIDLAKSWFLSAISCNVSDSLCLSVIVSLGILLVKNCDNGTAVPRHIHCTDKVSGFCTTSSLTTTSSGVNTPAPSGEPNSATKQPGDVVLHQMEQEVLQYYPLNPHVALLLEQLLVVQIHHHQSV